MIVACVGNSENWGMWLLIGLAQFVLVGIFIGWILSIMVGIKIYNRSLQEIPEEIKTEEVKIENDI